MVSLRSAVRLTTIRPSVALDNENLIVTHHLFK